MFNCSKKLKKRLDEWVMANEHVNLPGSFFNVLVGFGGFIRLGITPSRELAFDLLRLVVKYYRATVKWRIRAEDAEDEVKALERKVKSIASEARKWKALYEEEVKSKIKHISVGALVSKEDLLYYRDENGDIVNCEVEE